MVGDRIFQIFFFSSEPSHPCNPGAPSSFSRREKSHRSPLKVMPVDHAEASQGFTGAFSIGVQEAETSGGDEPRVHIWVAGAPCQEDHQVAPKSALGVVLPVKKLWRVHNSDAFQAEYQQLRKAGLCVTDSAIHCQPSGTGQEPVVSVCVKEGLREE